MTAAERGRVGEWKDKDYVRACIQAHVPVGAYREASDALRRMEEAHDALVAERDRLLGLIVELAAARENHRVVCNDPKVTGSTLHVAADRSRAAEAAIARAALEPSP